MHFIQLTFKHIESKILINVKKIISIKEGVDKHAGQTVIETDDAEIIVQEDYETVVAMLDQLRDSGVHVTKKVYTPHTSDKIVIKPEFPADHKS
jgi:hypothetical protein